MEVDEARPATTDAVEYDGDNEQEEDGQLASAIRKTDGIQLNVSSKVYMV